MFRINFFPFQFEEISANIISAMIFVGFSVAYVHAYEQPERVFKTTQLTMIAKAVEGSEMSNHKFRANGIFILGPREAATFPGVRFQAVVSNIFSNLEPTVEMMNELSQECYQHFCCINCIPR